MKIGDRLTVEIEVTGYDETVEAFIAHPVSPDWFLSESGHLLQTSMHWGSQAQLNPNP